MNFAKACVPYCRNCSEVNTPGNTFNKQVNSTQCDHKVGMHIANRCMLQAIINHVDVAYCTVAMQLELQWEEYLF